MKMKKTRKRIALLVMLCMLTMLLPVGTGYAADETIDIIQDGIKYSLRAGISTTSAPANQAYITGYTSDFAGGEVTIPETITPGEITYTVRTIRKTAFRDCTALKCISIPKGVYNIEKQAFLNCSSLKKITFDVNDGILYNIDEGAFQGTALVEVVLPDNLNTNYADGSLLLSAFSGCTSLTTINVSVNNANFSSVGGVLFNKAGTTLIRYPEGKSGTYSLSNNVITITKEAFSNCKQLQGITFEEYSKLQTIGSGAFIACTSLQTITLPTSLTKLTPVQGYRFSDTFSGCTGLTDIQVADNNTNYSSIEGVLFSKDKKKLVCYPEGKTASSYTIPSTVATIGEKAFADCEHLTTVNFDAGVTVIGNRAFENCTDLTNIHIPAQVTEIGYNAFSGCTALSALTFAEDSKLQTINTWAFQDCSSLTNITIPKQVTTLHDDAFKNCTGLTKVTFKEGNTLQDIASSTFANCTALTEINLPESITSIGEYAFENCSSLTSITIPQKVYKIDIDAFSGCTSLSKVTFDEGSCLSEIAGNAFRNCTGLTNITIPKSVKAIGGDAFSGCSNLRLVTFENESNLSRLEPGAFANCSNDLYIIYNDSSTINWDSAGIKSSQVKSKVNTNALSSLQLQSRTSKTITLKAEPDTQGTAAEYRMQGGAWQDSPIFTGLTPNTSYTFEARYKATTLATPSGITTETFTTLAETASSGWSPSASGPTLNITGQEGGSAVYDANKHTLTITPNADWLVEAVSVDGTPVVVTDGVMVLEHIYSWSKVSVSFAKKPEAPVKDNSKLVSGVKQTKLYASSKSLKQNKIRLTWRKANGYKVDYYLVYRAAKKNGKYQLVYTTKRADQKSYTGIRTTKSGKRYYYKIRGVRLIDDKKYYTKDSNIISRK